MRDDTDTDVHDDGHQHTERPADDRDRAATSDADRVDPVEGQAYEPVHRPADDRATDDGDVLAPAATEDDRHLRSGDEPQPTAAAVTDEPEPAARTGEQAAGADRVESAAGPEPVGEPSAGPEQAESAELMPGQAAAEPATTGWTTGAAEDMRARWQELQLRFVDDPGGVAGEARVLVAEAVQGLTNALAEEQRQLDSWSPDDGGDTEQLRVIVQRYRDFFDRMLDRAA